jgi:hypothetical protein
LPLLIGFFSAFEVGSYIILVTSSSKSLSSRILKTLAFQALKFEAPSSLSFALTEEEALLKTVYTRDLMQNKLTADLEKHTLNIGSTQAQNYVTNELLSRPKLRYHVRI